MGRCFKCQTSIKSYRKTDKNEVKLIKMYCVFILSRQVKKINYLDNAQHWSLLLDAVLVYMHTGKIVFYFHSHSIGIFYTFVIFFITFC